MARTFKIATAEGSEEREGVVMWLRLGDGKHRFVLHDEDSLSDYRTGRRFGSISGVQMQAYVNGGRSLNNRNAAQLLVYRTVDIHGLAKVREQLAKYPTLNT
jgi:hypothetical protein